MPPSTRRLAVAALAVATIAASISITESASIARASTGCASTFNLFIPGTWETSDTADPTQAVGMLAPVAAALTKDHGTAVENYFLPYMSRAFDNGKTYGQSEKTAVDNSKTVLGDYSARCPKTTYTITGYSQGADAAGDLASDIGNGEGPISADKVLAVGLLSDPNNGTKGESTVGPTVEGQGIAGTRSKGMGSLSGRVASICDSQDLYCNTKSTNPFLKALGSVLSSGSNDSGDSSGGSGGSSGQSGNGGKDQSGKSNAASTLVSDFSKADLTGLASTLGSLTSKLTSGNVDVSSVLTDVNKLIGTISPLSDLFTSGAANQASVSGLTNAPAGTKENNAGQVLNAAGSSDLSGALSTLTAVGEKATTLLNSGVTALNSGSTDLSSLLSSVTSLGTQISGLSSLGSSTLSGVSGVLSVFKVNTLISQATNVITNITAFDWAGILANLALLPQKVAALDAKGAHEVAGALNNQFQPLIKMIAGVDLSWISSILSIIPDPQGYTQIAALVVSILAKVDVVRIANDVGQIQEVAWSALEKLFPPAGQASDPVAAMASLTGLLPIGLDLASAAVNMLTGTAAKTSTDQLGKSSSVSKQVSTISTQAQNLNLSGLISSIASMATSSGASDLSTLVSDGLSAVSFFTSGAHQNYGSLKVDNSGRTAVQWLGEWESLQIGRSA